MRAIFYYLFSIWLLSVPAQAERLQYLPSAPQSLQQRIALIEGATKTIDLATLIFDPCSVTSRIFAKALKERAKAGVRVRVLIDGFNPDPDILQSFAQDLNRSGIEVRLFNPASHYGLMATNRSHAKLLLVDGARFITGGRNLADEYFGLKEGLNFVDRDVLVEGNVAREAAAGFQLLWKNQKAKTAPMAGRDFPKLEGVCPRGGREENSVRAALVEAVKLEAPVECRSVEFTIDDPSFADIGVDRNSTEEYLNGQRLQLKHTSRAILEELGRTRKSLVMENWTYLPSFRIDSALESLRDKSIPITVITNQFSDELKAFSALTREFAERDTKGSSKVLLLSAGGAMGDAWKITPKKVRWVLHAKVFVMDGRDAIVSSYNLDPRSYAINAESALLVRDCPEFAGTVLKESRKLRAIHHKERNCRACEAEAGYSFLDTLFGYLAFTLL